MSLSTETPAGATSIRPLHVDVPAEALEDLRRRLATTRWPGKELVADRSQGVQLATIQALTRYWATEHDWRSCEADLNALPQFKTEIDGLDKDSSSGRYARRGQRLGLLRRDDPGKQELQGNRKRVVADTFGVGEFFEYDATA